MGKGVEEGKERPDDLLVLPLLLLLLLRVRECLLPVDDEEEAEDRKISAVCRGHVPTMTKCSVVAVVLVF